MGDLSNLEILLVITAVSLAFFVLLLFWRTDDMSKNQNELKEQVREINAMIDVARMHEESGDSNGLPRKWRKPKVTRCR